MAQIYEVNAIAEPTVSFKKKIAGVVTAGDPDFVYLRWTDPDGFVTTKTYSLAGADPEIVRDAEGEFHGTIKGTKPGVWAYRWIGQGGIDDEKEGFFVVKIPRVTVGTPPPAVEDTALSVKFIKQVVRRADFIDDGADAGHMHLTKLLPANATPLAAELNVTIGYTGDTAASLRFGVDSDTDTFGYSGGIDCSTAAFRFAWDTQSAVFGVAQQVRVTITGSSDFTLITTGEMTITLFYVEAAP